MKISRILLGLGLSLLISSHLVHAKSRNCNALEKAQGNAYLLQIEDDQTLKGSILNEQFLRHDKYDAPALQGDLAICSDNVRTATGPTGHYEQSV